jgi:hypothetical protein
MRPTLSKPPDTLSKDKAMDATPIIYAVAVLILATSVSLCLGTLTGAWITFAARTGKNPVPDVPEQLRKLFGVQPKTSPQAEDNKPRGPLAKP